MRRIYTTKMFSEHFGTFSAGDLSEGGMKKCFENIKTIIVKFLNVYETDCAYNASQKCKQYCVIHRCFHNSLQKPVSVIHFFTPRCIQVQSFINLNRFESNAKILKHRHVFIFIYVFPISDSNYSTTVVEFLCQIVCVLERPKTRLNYAHTLSLSLFS